MKQLLLILIALGALGFAGYKFLGFASTEDGAAMFGTESREDRMSKLSYEANGHRVAGRYREASDLMEQVVDLGRSDPDRNQSSWLTDMSLLAKDYMKQGRYSEAVVVLEELLPLQTEFSGPNFPQTQVVRSLLEDARRRSRG